MNTPVVLFLFKRNKVLKIIEQISKVKPKRLYLLADYGRTPEEKLQCDELREKVENAINWDCEVYKHYANENIGVYKNIGLGAKWIFEREERAIFLEDDNYPEITFFKYCEDMLYKFENEEKVLWICGTNYLVNYKNDEKKDVFFTRHMLPCGWASWSHKFNKYYDGDLHNLENADFKKMKDKYPNKKLANQFRKNWLLEKNNIKKKGVPCSWDYQMDFTLKYYDLFGIAPCYNQIKNIGDDDDSIHGGVSMDNVMTSRFCENETIPFTFPLKTPEYIKIDDDFEEEIGKVILVPREKFKVRLRRMGASVVRKLFKIPDNCKVGEFFKKNK